MRQHVKELVHNKDVCRRSTVDCIELEKERRRDSLLLISAPAAYELLSNSLKTRYCQPQNHAVACRDLLNEFST